MKITHPENNFSLHIHELVQNELYECDNGSVVISAQTGTDAINITNGVGCYGEHRMFRELRRGTKIEFTVGE
jgi:hypothetical protein